MLLLNQKNSRKKRIYKDIDQIDFNVCNKKEKYKMQANKASAIYAQK